MMTTKYKSLNNKNILESIKLLPNELMQNIYIFYHPQMPYELINQIQTYKKINIYTLNLNPENYQPSGFINLSKVRYTYVFKICETTNSRVVSGSHSTRP